MIGKQIVLSLLLVAIVFFSWRVIYGLLLFMFKKDKSAMYVPSFNRHIRLMKNNLQLVRWKKLVDLWCGDGKAMRFFAETFWLQCDGYELQRFPYLYGKLINRVLWYKKLKLYKQNFSLQLWYILAFLIVLITIKVLLNLKSDMFSFNFLGSYLFASLFIILVIILFFYLK